MRYNNNKFPNNLTDKPSLTLRQIVLLIIGGVLVGIIAGLFGGGGGIVVVPLITLVGKLGEKEAHASSIAVILPVAIVCSIVYFINGTRMEITKGSVVVIGVFLGGVLGAFLLKKLSNKLLSIIFYILMIVAGVKMLL